MDLGLSGKRAIVTGGTRGIGRAIVQRLLAEGARVATCARTPEGVARLLAETGPGLTAEALDVRDSAAFTSWFERSREAMGGIDIAISNVSTRVTSTGEDGWRESFEADLLQHVRFGELAIPQLREGRDPSMVFLSSIAAVLKRLPPGEEAYGPMKAALVNYSGQLAERNGAAGVRVNTVSPGPIFFEGGVWDQIRERIPALFQSAANLAALGRHGTPDEVANVVVFLASPAAGFVTGTNVRVDGGAVKTANF
jgi:NAD(P)-dependent dehydrogenase (short-subunit alcohol dehydrogenase family)